MPHGRAEKSNKTTVCPDVERVGFFTDQDAPLFKDPRLSALLHAPALEPLMVLFAVAPGQGRQLPHQRCHFICVAVLVDPVQVRAHVAKSLDRYRIGPHVFIDRHQAALCDQLGVVLLNGRADLLDVSPCASASEHAVLLFVGAVQRASIPLFIKSAAGRTIAGHGGRFIDEIPGVACFGDLLDQRIDVLKAGRVVVTAGGAPVAVVLYLVCFGV